MRTRKSRRSWRRSSATDSRRVFKSSRCSQDWMPAHSRRAASVLSRPGVANGARRRAIQIWPRAMRGVNGVAQRSRPRRRSLQRATLERPPSRPRRLAHPGNPAHSAGPNWLARLRAQRLLGFRQRWRAKRCFRRRNTIAGQFADRARVNPHHFAQRLTSLRRSRFTRLGRT
jgi:hypothetical protein